MQLRQQNSHDPEHVAIVFSFLDDFNIVVNPIVVLKVRLEKRASQNLMHDYNANKNIINNAVHHFTAGKCNYQQVM